MAEFQRGAPGPNQLPYGQATAANRAMKAPGPQHLGLPAPLDEDDTAAFATPEEQFLFAPTDQPGQPLTAGAPFGPGANSLPRPDTDRDITARIVADLQTQAPRVPGLGKLAERISRGL